MNSLLSATFLGGDLFFLGGGGIFFFFSLLAQK